MFPDRDHESLKEYIKDHVTLAVLANISYATIGGLTVPEYRMVVSAYEELKRDEKWASKVPSGVLGRARIR